MEAINIPAQVTTVEDKIIGNLNLTQLALLIAPIFIDFVFYAVLPGSFRINAYKVFVMTCLSLVFLLSAIRHKETILLFSAITLIRFKLRPKIYVFSKKSIYLRNPYTQKELPEKNTKAKPISKPENSHKREEFSDLNKLDLKFVKQKKGRLYVYINQS